MVAAAVVGSAVVGVAGASMQAGAASDAADAQAQAADRATAAQTQAADNSLALQKDQYDKNVQMQEPYRQTGLAAQNRLMEYLGISPDVNAKDVNGNPVVGLEDRTGSADYGKYGKEYSPADFAQGIDPGYQFRLSEGIKALNATAASRGGLISGAALKAATNYGQQAASQEYTNAFNRYQTSRANILNPLQSLVGVGQTGANQAQASSTNYANQGSQTYNNLGNQVGSNELAKGNAYGAAAMASGNAYGNAFGNVGKAFNAGIYGQGNNAFNFNAGTAFNGTGTMSDLQNTNAFSSGGYNPSLFS